MSACLNTLVLGNTGELCLLCGWLLTDIIPNIRHRKDSQQRVTYRKVKISLKI